MIASEFIYQAFRKIGQLRPGAGSTPELMQDALTEWAAFFDELAAERNTQYSNPVFQYPVTGPGSLTGGNGYSIGPIFTFTGTTSIGSASITAVSNIFGLVVGQKVSGTGIPAGSTIATISPTAITISHLATAAGVTVISVTPDFVGPRPESIIRANLVFTSQGPQPVYIQLQPVTQEQWASLAILQIPATNVTSIFWYDPQFPQGVINVFPPLNGNALQFYTWGVLSPPASLATVYTAPPGYWDMVVFGLAERLYYMATKGVVIKPAPYAIIAAKAQLARDKVRRVNRPIPRLANDFSSRGAGGASGFYDSFVTYTGEPY